MRGPADARRLPAQDAKLSKEAGAPIAAAADLLRRRHVRGGHTVGAAVRTASGRVLTGINLDGIHAPGPSLSAGGDGRSPGARRAARDVRCGSTTPRPPTPSRGRPGGPGGSPRRPRSRTRSDHSVRSAAAVSGRADAVVGIHTGSSSSTLCSGSLYSGEVSGPGPVPTPQF